MQDVTRANFAQEPHYDGAIRHDERKADSSVQLWDLLPFWPALALGPALVLGAAGLVGRGPRLLRDNRALSGALVGAALLGVAKWQLDRFFTETPDYEVVKNVNGLQIRKYAPRVVAETTMTGAAHDGALNEGFRRLAGYIFGDNQGERTSAPASAADARDEPRKGDRIAMTTPVTSHAEETGVTVAFTMPRKRPLELLPIPNDGRIRVRRTEAERVAVLSYRGTYRAGVTGAKKKELLERAIAAGLTPRGAPRFAGYDAPSTAPFLRRVEVWLPIE